MRWPEALHDGELSKYTDDGEMVNMGGERVVYMTLCGSPGESHSPAGGHGEAGGGGWYEYRYGQLSAPLHTTATVLLIRGRVQDIF